MSQEQRSAKWPAIVFVVAVLVVATVWVLCSLPTSPSPVSGAQADAKTRADFHGADPDGVVALGPTSAPIAREADEATHDEPVAATRDSIESARATFFGRVVSEQGHPIENAHVITSAGGEAFSGSDGVFELGWTVGQSSMAEVSAPGTTRRFFEIEAGHETIEAARRIVLWPEATLLVTVRQTPIEILAVLCFSESGWLAGEGDETYPDTTADGSVARFTITNLPAGLALSVELNRSDQSVTYRRIDVVLEPGEVRELELDLSAGAVVHGSLMDPSGSGVPGQEMWILPDERRLDAYLHASDDPMYRAFTDDLGRFEFVGIEPGRWRVGASPVRQVWQTPDEELVAPVAELVEIEPGDENVEVVLTAHRGLYIRGVLLHPDGSPTKGGEWVSAVCADKDLRVSKYSLPHGVFVLGPLVPGRYEIGTRASGDFSRPETVFADAGAADVVLRFRRGRRLTGTLVDGATGAPSRGVLGVSLVGGTEEDVHGGRVNRSGSFEVPGLLPGEYAVVARGPDGYSVGPEERAAIVRVAFGAADEARDVVVVLERAATLDVSHDFDCRFANVDVWLDDAYVGWRFLSKMHGDRMIAPPGRLRVVLTASGREYERTVDVAAGEERVVHFGRE